MNVWQSVRIAGRALRVNKLRSALTMLGIIIGVSAVIAMVGVGSGAQARVAEQIQSLGSNLIIVLSGSTNSAGVTTCKKPALTTPTRACHSFLAARQRCTKCWLVQLYQMPTLRKLVNTPVNGNSSCRALWKTWNFPGNSCTSCGNPPTFIRPSTGTRTPPTSSTAICMKSVHAAELRPP